MESRPVVASSGVGVGGASGALGTHEASESLKTLLENLGTWKPRPIPGLQGMCALLVDWAEQVLFGGTMFGGGLWRYGVVRWHNVRGGSLRIFECGALACLFTSSMSHCIFGSGLDILLKTPRFLWLMLPTLQYCPTLALA